MTALAFVAAAGAGAVLRWVVALRANHADALPWGTLVVNIAGTAALALASGVTPPAATVLGAGALGSFTTFSTFAVEVDVLRRSGDGRIAVAYLAVTVLGCLVAGGIGLALAP